MIDAPEAEPGENDFEAADEEQLVVVADSQIQLSTGELLSVAEVERFLLWRAANFIAMVGDSNSGKTTLMCALYDRFLRGPFAGFSFVSSRSLVALEKRIYPSRLDSRREVPDTPRTSIQDGVRYFHLAVFPIDEASTDRVDLLISDRAGETYRLARNNTERIADLSEISRADTVVLLLDGARVAEPAERAGAVQSARQMLRALLDNGALDGRSSVQIVTTKVDRIAKADDSETAREAVAAFQHRTTSDFGPRLGSLVFRDVAARDPDGSFDPGHGMDALLSDWIRPRPPTPPSTVSRLEFKSEFDRLMKRTPMVQE